MTQEEKAKAYDEAIKKAKDMLSYKEVRREDMEYLFPELKESEDERIRKRIIHALHGDVLEMSEIKEAVDWLEKQGKNNMGISETTKQNLEDSLHNALEKETPESCNEFLEKQGEQILANSAKTCKDEQKPVEWSEEDEKMYALTLLSLARFMGNGDKIDWLKSLKDRVQPKQEWSKEDENTVASIISSLSNPQLYPPTIHDIEWLKSLRPQNRWKPSDEQMDALHYVTNFDYGGHKATLVSLYEQLKKLKG